MKVANVSQLKTLLDSHGMGVDESGVARVKPVEPAPLPVPMPDTQLLQAVRELTMAVQTKEPPIIVQPPAVAQPMVWEFTVKRGMDNLIESIIARAK